MYTLHHADGSTAEVVAWQTQTPGLVVAKLPHWVPLRRARWAVVHERSGATVGYAETPEHAQYIAGVLVHESAPGVDWTASANDVDSQIGDWVRPVWSSSNYDSAALTEEMAQR